MTDYYRQLSIMRKMQPGTFGGQSMVATPVSPSRLLDGQVVVGMPMSGSFCMDILPTVAVVDLQPPPGDTVVRLALSSGKIDGVAYFDGVDTLTFWGGENGIWPDFKFTIVTMSGTITADIDDVEVNFAGGFHLYHPDEDWRLYGHVRHEFDPPYDSTAGPDDPFTNWYMGAGSSIVKVYGTPFSTDEDHPETIMITGGTVCFDWRIDE